jgi:ribulose-5-phosphate 4-epimerase/fuculose-1-phosphate aldolase
MAKRKTSVEKAREESDLEAVGDLFGSAFSVPDAPEPSPEENDSTPEDGADIAESVIDFPNDDAEDESIDPIESEETPSAPSGPPSVPPSGPPSALPSLPPSGPPSGPPTGPPPSPPSGPPPFSPPSGEEKVDLGEDETETTESINQETDSYSESEREKDSKSEKKETSEEPTDVEEEQTENENQEDTSESDPEEDLDTEKETIEQIEDLSQQKQIIPSADRIKASDEEVKRLSSEVTSLRQSLAGAVDIIEEMETPPMPPVVYQDIIIPDHIVVSIARLSRQLNRDGLVRANMGTISMLHPGMPGVMISTKEGVLLARLDERDIVVGRLGEQSPPQAPEDWRLLEVLLASKSLETNGPATCLHVHGPYSTVVSCEKDLIVCTPIDHAGKKHIGKIIIVDPDDDNPEDFLRQTAEALKQGGMKCVVIRGHGAFVVGATLEDAWANAAMLEHSMKIVLLARQANLRI